MSEQFPYCRALDRGEALSALAKRVETRLSPAEIADTCGFLREEGTAPGAIGAALRLPAYRVSQYLAVAHRLSPELKGDLHRGLLTFGQARALARMTNPDQQRELGRRAARGTASVRDLEAVVRGADARLTAEDRAYYARLSGQIGDHIGHPVSITPDADDRRAGVIVIRYENLDMFDAVCARLRVNLAELS